MFDFLRARRGGPRLRLRVPVAGAVALALGGGGLAHAYRFFGVPSEGAAYEYVVDAADAPRWDSSAFPLRFRLLENDRFPDDVAITRATWREIVERGFEHWNRISGAQVSLILEEEPHLADRPEVEDRINSIGFSGYEGWPVSWGTAFAQVDIAPDTGTIRECDVEFSPFFRKNWSPQDPVVLLEVVVTHEIGHCLGLAHSEPNPMPLWTDEPVTRAAGFLPDPVMSYSNSYGLPPPPDEVTAVSLLYPAPGFLDSRGSLRGVVRGVGAGGLSFVYVQAIEMGAGGARAGPGVFTRRDGTFHLEGAPPGPVLLWIRPILVVRRNAHSMFDAAASNGSLDYRDQWRWVTVRAGAVTEVSSVWLDAGRAVSP